jgi:hypothetical protein
MAKSITCFNIPDRTKVHELILPKLEEMINLGKTTGHWENADDTPEKGQYITERDWIDLEAAQAWVDFINTIEIPANFARAEN